ncbi:fimbrial protein [Shimwellia blattae]|uniref:Fimbrial protein n=1 Tax=Shimwellia blattae (strain ATCC 29907 / DSM 4481 / JCM 1650 / NBRC 105725 / CDC 9005-74) TaxID=630626 RepID=I2B8P4_SHIBC|nr:fimbrial protein [Shimwellia blattae]AFJ46898.1 fimbrial protein [Shimwellia blattae DSM 4481 = NBRC 105725]GAB82441.1 putative fimbrial-like protein [Shimwellia blattae DSM 4481 = NBRC 105725]VDY64384.1 S-fimbrial protein subunit SfaG precursor [Shimwellia blattae]VEC22500.1 S-fimbrial protein subunit SfaG precursor [Shimwellia blattae]
MGTICNTHAARGLLAAALLLGTSTTASGAELARINIRIGANLVANTCAVSNVSQNMTVNLGEWAAKQFLVTKTSQPVRFIVQLENCGAAARGVAVTFKGATTTRDTSLLALNRASTASNVGIAILDKDLRRLTPGQPSPRYPINLPLPAGGVPLVFYGQYVATGPVTPGSANSEATFELNYP